MTMFIKGITQIFYQGDAGGGGLNIQNIGEPTGASNKDLELLNEGDVSDPDAEVTDETDVEEDATARKPRQDKNLPGETKGDEEEEEVDESDEEDDETP